MRDIVGVTEAAVAAELLCWIGAALLDGLGFLPPVSLLCQVVSSRTDLSGGPTYILSIH